MRVYLTSRLLPILYSKLAPLHESASAWIVSFCSKQQDPCRSANQIYLTPALFGTAYTALTIEDHGKLVAIDTDTESSQSKARTLRPSNMKFSRHE